MQYKVPQGVDMQDRILGPLTLIQFGFLLFGGLAAYFLYLKLPKPVNFWAALGLFALSMLVSFDNVRKMILAAILFFTKPRARVWHKVSESARPAISQAVKTKTSSKKNLIQKKSGPYKDIAELANILDSHGREGSNK